MRGPTLPAPPERQRFRRQLLDWYRKNGRDLPWRRTSDPYHVLVSEVMLQQTQTVKVLEYYERFLARFPDLPSLARAREEAVLRLWSGLGYYARARNLHKCARTVSANHGGRFPDQEDALRALPGIGPYTAAAVAAIAFDRRATAMDGNVERVIARLFAVTAPSASMRMTASLVCGLGPG